MSALMKCGTPTHHHMFGVCQVHSRETLRAERLWHVFSNGKGQPQNRRIRKRPREFVGNFFDAIDWHAREILL